MGRLRRVVEVGALVLCAGVLGCQSAPSGGTRPAPSPTVARAIAPPAPTAAAAPRPASNPNVWAVSPTDTPAPLRTVVAVPTAEPAPPTAAAVPPRADGTVGGAPAAAPAPPFAGIPTAQPPPPRPARAFRTPERPGEPVFMAPQGGAATTAESDATGGAVGMGNGTDPRATSAVVIFRASATATLLGFDIRASYAQGFGHFVSNANGAQCTGAAGATLTANDTGKGEIRVLVASGVQALAFPMDIFCPFTVTSGERLDASAFQIRVAEVALDTAKPGDPALLSVSVAVR